MEDCGRGAEAVVQLRLARSSLDTEETRLDPDHAHYRLVGMRLFPKSEYSSGLLKVLRP